jgi:hypothetical protein
LDRRFAHTDPLQPTFFYSPLADALNHSLTHGRIADDTALPYFFAAGLKLRLDERHDICRGPEYLYNSRQNLSQRDEGNVDTGKRGGLRQSFLLEVAGVNLIHHNDPWILPYLPVKLSFAHIYGKHFARSVLKETIRESAGGSAYVKTDDPFDIETKSPKSLFEFLPTPTCKTLSIRLDLQSHIQVESMARLCGRLSVDLHLSCHDKSLGLFAAFRKSTLNQKHV